MNKKLKNLIEDYKQTDWSALLREDLGKHNLKEIKPSLDFAKNFIDLLVKNSHNLSINQQKSLIDLLESFFGWREAIKTHADTNQNKQIIHNSMGFKDYIADNFQSLSVALIMQENLDPDKTQRKHGAKKQLSKMKELLEETRRIEGRMAEKEKREAKEHEVARYGNFFKQEAEKNRQRSFWTGLAFFILSVGFAAISFSMFNQNIDADSFADFLIKGNVINKIFIFSVMLFALSTVRREYLALRHQFTLNTHRHNALSSHKEILISIKKTANESDKEISNAVLLELTKSMFSPQDTGFVKSQASSASRIVEISKSLFRNSKE